VDDDTEDLLEWFAKGPAKLLTGDRIRQCERVVKSQAQRIEELEQEAGSYHLASTAGIDNDIFYAAAMMPNIGPPILANAYGHGDIADGDRIPSVVVDNLGRAHFAWQSDADLGGRIGTDIDFLYSSVDGLVVTHPMVVNHLLGRNPLTGFNLARADANADGTVNTADVITLISQGR